MYKKIKKKMKQNILVGDMIQSDSKIVYLSSLTD